MDRTVYKTAYAPGFINLLAVAKSGRIGKIHDVEAAFTKLVPAVSGAREYDRVSGGSFTELASYPLLPILKLLGINYQNVHFDFTGLTFTQKHIFNTMTL